MCNKHIFINEAKPGKTWEKLKISKQCTVGSVFLVYTIFQGRHWLTSHVLGIYALYSPPGGRAPQARNHWCNEYHKIYQVAFLKSWHQFAFMFELCWGFNHAWVEICVHEIRTFAKYVYTKIMSGIYSWNLWMPLIVYTETSYWTKKKYKNVLVSYFIAHSHNHANFLTSIFVCTQSSFTRTGWLPLNK